DWACLRRIDHSSTFGRILDWDKAGYCRFAPTAEAEVSRRYLGDTLTLETTYRTATGAVRVTDLLALDRAGYPEGRLVRIPEGLRPRRPDRRHDRGLVADPRGQRHPARPAPVGARAPGPRQRRHGRHRRRGHDVDPRGRRRRLDLGLPLHLDPRLVAHRALP